MTETMVRTRLRDDGYDNEEIEARLDERADRQRQERKDRELEDKHLLKLAELYHSYPN